MKTVSKLVVPKLVEVGHTDHADRANPVREVPPRDVLETAGDLLRALAAPVRIAIVLQLREASRCVHELVDALGVPQPLVSQHLRILKSAGVVAGERDGREVHYRLVDHHLSDIVLAAVAHAGEYAGDETDERHRSSCYPPTCSHLGAAGGRRGVPVGPGAPRRTAPTR